MKSIEKGSGWIREKSMIEKKATYLKKKIEIHMYQWLRYPNSWLEVAEVYKFMVGSG